MTSPVPIASDNGRLRRGFLTSPAVKVTLFQASAEKSEPTCATHTAINNPSAPPVGRDRGHERKVGFDRRDRDRRPHVGEVGAERGGISSNEETEDDQRQQG